jgi:hypothetical protein
MAAERSNCIIVRNSTVLMEREITLSGQTPFFRRRFCAQSTGEVFPLSADIDMVTEGEKRTPDAIGRILRSAAKLPSSEAFSLHPG